MRLQMSSNRLNIYILNTNNFRFVQIHPRVIRDSKNHPAGEPALFQRGCVYFFHLSKNLLIRQPDFRISSNLSPERSIL